VITSKANIEGQVNEKKWIEGGGYKVWLNEVNGFDKNDPVNGYAGILGKPITSIRVDGGTAYRVHLLDLQKWLGKITRNDQTDPNSYAGHINGKPIDGFVIGGGVKYSAHILGGDWLPVVNGYNLTDSTNGYAGIFGKPIDAIMIQGRNYATSYTEESSSPKDKCTIQGGTCISSNVCNNGNIIKGLCTDQAAANCCIPGTTNGKQGKDSTLNVLYIVGIVLAVIIAIIVVLFIYFSLSKQWIKRSITSSIKNIPTLNNDNNNNNINNINNINHQEDLPPSYFDVVNENEDLSNLLNNNTSMRERKITSSNTHSQVKLPNSNSLKSGFHSGIGMSKSEKYSEKKGFPSDIKSSQSERIIRQSNLENNQDDDDDDIIIERINNDDRRVTFTMIERSKAVIVNNGDTENNQNNTDNVTITIPSIERSKALNLN